MTRASSTMTPAEVSDWEDSPRTALFRVCPHCTEVFAPMGFAGHRVACERRYVPPPPPRPAPLSPDCPMCGKRMRANHGEYECLVHGTSYGRRLPTPEEMGERTPERDKKHRGPSTMGRML